MLLREVGQVFDSDMAMETTNEYLDLYGREDEGGHIIGMTILDDEWINQGALAGSSEIIAPDASIDGSFRYPKENIDPTFVQYLRRSIAVGASPALRM